MTARHDVAASHTWGSSCRILLGGPGPSQSVQLASINLPEPAVCSCYFQARLLRKSDPEIFVRRLSLNLVQGVGRVSVPRAITFANQPSLQTLGPLPGLIADGPIEYTFASLPLQALQVNVIADGNMNLGQTLEIECYFVLAPITRIAGHQAQKLDFGMSVPGEADALDDELRDELEEDAPSVAAIMAGDDEPADDEPDEGDERRRRAFALDIAQQLARRLGRRPSQLELKAALTRIAARNARRRRRA